MMASIKCRPAAPAKSLPQEAPHELAAVRTALDEAHAEAIAFLKANPESVLTEKCSLAEIRRRDRRWAILPYHRARNRPSDLRDAQTGETAEIENLESSIVDRIDPRFPPQLTLPDLHSLLPV